MAALILVLEGTVKLPGRPRVSIIRAVPLRRVRPVVRWTPTLVVPMSFLKIWAAPSSPCPPLTDISIIDLLPWFEN